jgi:predicted HTH domain antitoxin
MPRAVLSALRKEPAGFAADMRIAAAVKWYELEMVSQAKAAEIAGLSRAEFLRALSQFEVSPFQSSAEQLVEESRDA